MKRFIVEIHDDIPDLEAFAFVEAVIRGGKVSGDGKQYCYATFDRTNGRCCIDPPVRGKSERFIVRNIANA